jgi:hypothetical protein
LLRRVEIGWCLFENELLPLGGSRECGALVLVDA